jgi:flagellar P-ring protein precursor FlgI
VVINERTGTVVVGGNVMILPSVVAHGGLEISIQKKIITPQGVPFSPWIPSAYENSEIQTNEEISPSVVVSPQPTAGQTTVAAMADALNRLNVSPRDLIAIFQALKESGALQGELIIQ